MKSSDGARALILVGHGSRLRGFQAPMKKLAGELAREKEFKTVLCAYLEITRPSIPQAIRHGFKKGAKEIIVLPYFLLMGRHTQKDIPDILAAQRKIYGRRIKIRLCPYLGYDEKILSIAKQRIGEGR